MLMLGLVGGSADASSTFECNPSGRAICIATTDADNVTHSTATIDRYTTYTIQVNNGGSSTLTNVSFTAELKDLVDGIEVATTGRFVAAPSGCTSTSTTSFTCTQPNLRTGSTGPVFHAFARTSTNTSASDLVLVVTATSNERGNDSEGPASTPDTFTSRQLTSLEPRDDFSQSVYFLDGSTLLNTTEGVGGQSSVFRIPVPSGFNGFQLGTLEEFNSGSPGYFCPTGFTCFGQSVTTNAPFVFSASNPANLLSTVSLSLLPRGVTERSLHVHHNGVSFTTACSGALGTAPSAAQLPCRRVVIDRRAGTITIDAWDFNQGNWGFS